MRVWTVWWVLWEVVIRNPSKWLEISEGWQYNYQAWGSNTWVNCYQYGNNRMIDLGVIGQKPLNKFMIDHCIQLFQELVYSRCGWVGRPYPLIYAAASPGVSGLFNENDSLKYSEVIWHRRFWYFPASTEDPSPMMSFKGLLYEKQTWLYFCCLCLLSYCFHMSN